MDTGVAGRIGDLAAKHATMASEQDSERAPIHRRLMVGDFVQEVQMVRICVS